jgi:hypothetical protein
LEQARLSVPADTLPIVLADLGERRLADTGSLGTMMTEQGVWAPRISALGTQLLRFVTYMEPPDES